MTGTPISAIGVSPPPQRQAWLSGRDDGSAASAQSARGGRKGAEQRLAQFKEIDWLGASERQESEDHLAQWFPALRDALDQAHVFECV